jgi:rod shape determining protein RodA
MPASFVKTDWVLLVAVAFLAVAGLLMMVSLGSREQEPLFWFWRQAVWLAAGIAIMWGAAAVDYRLFRNSTAVVMAAYCFSVLLLLAVLASGTTINGAKSWFSFGGILFQPIEVAKIALILVLAKYYAAKNIELWRFRHVMITGAYTGIPALLAALQPDLGSALILVAVWFGMTIVSGIRRTPFIALLLLLAIGAALLWGYALSDRQKTRVRALLRPEAVSSAALYNVRQAVIAVGAGGIWGEGLGEGSQAQLKFLPAAKTDFVFAALGQELGLVGMVLLLAAFGVLFWRVLAIGERSGNNFAKLFAVGFFLVLASHVFVNIAMNLGIFPVIGIPLPFVSYGGSNLLANFLGLGILLSIRRYAFSYRDIEHE